MERFAGSTWLHERRWRITVRVDGCGLAHRQGELQWWSSTLPIVARNISFVQGGKTVIFVGTGDLLADGNWKTIGVLSMDMLWLSIGVRMNQAQSCGVQPYTYQLFICTRNKWDILTVLTLRVFVHHTCEPIGVDTNYLRSPFSIVMGPSDVETRRA